MKNVAKGEVKVIDFLIQHNLPLVTVDHLGPLFKSMFTDSKIYAAYVCGRIKNFVILNGNCSPLPYFFSNKHPRSNASLYETSPSQKKQTNTKTKNT